MSSMVSIFPWSARICRLPSRMRLSTLAKEIRPAGSGCSTDNSGLYPPVTIPSSGTGAVASPVVCAVWEVSSAGSARVSAATSVCSSVGTASAAFSPAKAAVASREHPSASTSSHAVSLFFILVHLSPILSGCRVSKYPAVPAAPGGSPPPVGVWPWRRSCSSPGPPGTG